MGFDCTRCAECGGKLSRADIEDLGNDTCGRCREGDPDEKPCGCPAGMCCAECDVPQESDDLPECVDNRRVRRARAAFNKACRSGNFVSSAATRFNYYLDDQSARYARRHNLKEFCGVPATHNLRRSRMG